MTGIPGSSRSLRVPAPDPPPDYEPDCDFGSLTHDVKTCPRCKEKPTKAKEKRPDADLVLFREPTEEIFLLGVMLVDAKTQTDLLKGLASAGECYRGDLRIIRGAAKRMTDRCSLLLGEKK